MSSSWTSSSACSSGTRGSASSPCRRSTTPSCEKDSSKQTMQCRRRRHLLLLPRRRRPQQQTLAPLVQAKQVTLPLQQLHLLRAQQLQQRLQEQQPHGLAFSANEKRLTCDQKPSIGSAQNHTLILLLSPKCHQSSRALLARRIRPRLMVERSVTAQWHQWPPRENRGKAMPVGEAARCQV